MFKAKFAEIVRNIDAKSYGATKIHRRKHK